MKIVEINAFSFGSTGKIMLQVADVARNGGHICYTFSSKRKSKEEYEGHTYIDSYPGYQLRYIEGSLLGDEFHFSLVSTLRLIKYIKDINPDVIQLHNIHGYYLNLPIFFKYLKRLNCKIVWTLHDCWSFTGRCPYFIMEKCNKWKTQCSKCSYGRKNYPANYYNIDLTKYNQQKKKQLFLGFNDLTLITPSEWLCDLVKQSFLKSYPVKVINNGIDLNIFYPRISNVREKLGIGYDKFIVIGVANGWAKRKGLEDFLYLYNKLDERYQILLVGTDDSIDSRLPDGIISIHRTKNQDELAELYSIADVFVNPTKEEVFGMVNVEALACGTPVITYQTGGSPETIDEKTGMVVPVGDMNGLKVSIEKVCIEKIFSREACVERAKKYDKRIIFQQYIDIYSSQ